MVKEGHLGTMLTRMASYVRLTGDQSTHEVETPSLRRAEQTLGFTAMILEHVYDAQRAVLRPKEPELSNEYKTAEEFQLLDFTKHDVLSAPTMTMSVTVLQVAGRTAIYVKNGKPPSKNKMEASIRAWLRQVGEC